MSDSTALVFSEGAEEFMEWPPVISDPPENSANLPDISSDTSSGTEEKIRVRARTSPSDPDRSVVLQRRDPFQVLQNWEGVVTSVEKDTFFASMRPTKSESERAEDEFEIDLNDVPEGDRDLVSEGAIFYLTVGIRRPRGEGPQPTTQIIFRRMPRWSSRDIERGEADGKDLWEKLQSAPRANEAVPSSEAR